MKSTYPNLIGTRILLVSILNYTPCHIVPLKSACPNKKSDHKRPTYLRSMHFQFRGEKCATKTPSLKVTNHCTNLLIGLWSNEQGESTTSYIWTHWAWETTSWSSKTSGKLPIVFQSRNLLNMPWTSKEKWKVHNMKLVGPVNIRISADYAQKSPQTLL